MTAEMKRAALRAGLESEGPFVAVGAHDAMTAQLIESRGFGAVWVSGFGVSTMAHALPDINLVTMTEALEAAIRINRATSLPVIADCDNGFGGLNNVVRTVQEYEAAGISGVCIEDNLFPKRNSLLKGDVVRELIPVHEQARRIREAKRSQVSDSFVFIARVEALIAGHGMEAACDRASAYAEAGADAILMHSKDPSLAELREFTSTWEGVGEVPLVAVPSLYPTYSASELADVGFSLSIFANQPMRAAVRALEETLDVLRETQTPASVTDSIAPLAHVFELVGTREMIDREAGSGEAMPSQ